MQDIATVTKRQSQIFPWPNKRSLTSLCKCKDNSIQHSCVSEQAYSLHLTSKSPPLSYPPHLNYHRHRYPLYNSRSSISDRFYSSNMHFPPPLLLILLQKPRSRILADKLNLSCSPQPRHMHLPITVSSTCPAKTSHTIANSHALTQPSQQPSKP